MKKFWMLAIALALLIPGMVDAAQYTVKRGDTLSRIGRELGVPWQKIARENKLANANYIRIGQVIQVAVPEPAKAQEKKAPKAEELQITQSSTASVKAFKSVSEKKEEKSVVAQAFPTIVPVATTAVAKAPVKTAAKEAKAAPAADESITFLMAWEGKVATDEWVDLFGKYSQITGDNGKEGNKNITTRYLDAAVYPVGIDSEYGRGYVGLGWKYSDWSGKTAKESSFEGKRELWSLRSKLYDHNDNWDLGLQYHFGRQEGNSRNAKGDWSGNNSASLHGPGANASWYARKNRGEQWFSETNAWASYLFAHDVKSSASFRGKATAYPYELSGIANLGIRQYIWDGPKESFPVRFYVESNFFGELPNSSFVNAQVGVSDRWGVLYASAGARIDLKNGLNYEIVEVGVDAGRALSLGIEKYRESQVGEAKPLEIKAEGGKLAFN